MENIPLNYLLFKKPFDENEFKNTETREYSYVRCNLLNTNYYFIYQMYKPISQIKIDENE
jgi:hypothetical protein